MIFQGADTNWKRLGIIGASNVSKLQYAEQSLVMLIENNLISNPS